MTRTWMTGALIALLASPAAAAPGFGSSSWTVSSESTRSDVDRQEMTALAMLLNIFNIRFDKNAVVPATDLTADERAAKAACEEGTTADGEKVAGAKKQQTSGPEPVYLAF